MLQCLHSAKKRPLPRFQWLRLQRDLIGEQEVHKIRDLDNIFSNEANGVGVNAIHAWEVSEKLNRSIMLQAEASDLLVPHDCWLALGNDNLRRLCTYQGLMEEALEQKQLIQIADALDCDLDDLF